MDVSENLSAAVRASVPLPAAERTRFVGEHLMAQSEQRPLPVATPLGSSVERSVLQQELLVLAEVLTGAVNAVSAMPGKPLPLLAQHLIELGNGANASRAAEAAAAPTASGPTHTASTAPPADAAPSGDAPSAAPTNPPTVDAPTAAGKGKKTARFAAASGPEPTRVGEPPKEISKEYEGEKSSDGMAEGKGRAVYANGDVYDGEWRSDRREGQGTCTYTNGETYEGMWKVWSCSNALLSTIAVSDSLNVCCARRRISGMAMGWLSM